MGIPIEDRYLFVKREVAVKNDRQAFEDYRNGKITKGTAIKMISKSNRTRMTTRQFDLYYVDLGYSKVENSDETD